MENHSITCWSNEHKWVLLVHKQKCFKSASYKNNDNNIIKYFIPIVNKYCCEYKELYLLYFASNLLFSNNKRTVARCCGQYV